MDSISYCSKRCLNLPRNFQSHFVSFYRDHGPDIQIILLIIWRSPLFSPTDPVISVQIPGPEQIVRYYIPKDIQGMMRLASFFQYCVIESIIISKLRIIIVFVNRTPADDNILFLKIIL